MTQVVPTEQQRCMGIFLNNLNWTTIATATNNFYNPPALTETTWFRRRAYATLGGNTCEDVTDAIRIGVFLNWIMELF